jgi:hypothetical protein
MRARGTGAAVAFVPDRVVAADKFINKLWLQLLGVRPSSWGWSCFVELQVT